jgi:hypothetical protein
MIVTLLIVHGLVAIALLGAITHQGLSVWRRPAPARGFVDRFRAVGGVHYADAIVVLYVTTFALGSYIYPTFVLDAKGAIADYDMRSTVFIFQMKEHIAVLGLGLLPAYWHYWRREPLGTATATRRLMTTTVTLATWWSLVVGHVVNNVRGLL